MEEDIILFLQSKSSIFLDILCFIYSYLISWIGAILVFIIIVFFVNRKFGLFFGFGFICTLIINYAIKVIINRPRPYETYPQIINKLQTKEIVGVDHEPKKRIKNLTIRGPPLRKPNL